GRFGNRVSNRAGHGVAIDDRQRNVENLRIRPSRCAGEIECRDIRLRQVAARGEREGPAARRIGYLLDGDRAQYDDGGGRAQYLAFRAGAGGNIGRTGAIVTRVVVVDRDRLDRHYTTRVGGARRGNRGEGAQIPGPGGVFRHVPAAI